MKRTARLYSLHATLLFLLAAGISFGAAFTSKKGFTIIPPAGWQTQKAAAMGTDVIFTAPMKDNFTANINVVVTPAPANTRLDQVFDQANKILPRMFTGYKHVGHGYTTLGGSRAAYNTATYLMGTPTKTIRLHQVFAVRNGQIYTLTVTTLASNHKRYEPAVQTSLKSFRWKK